MLACPNVRGFKLQSMWGFPDHQMRVGETPRSLLLRHSSCMGCFSTHWARTRAYGWCSSWVLRARIWERESLRSSPRFSEPDIEKLTMERGFINIASSEHSKIMCQSNAIQYLKHWDIRKIIYIYGLFLFPFWVVALEGQVFKLSLIPMTMARKGCVHKSFLTLYIDPPGGNVSVLVYFGSTICCQRGDCRFMKALPTPGQKNHLLPKILTRRHSYLRLPLVLNIAHWFRKK